VAAKVEMAEAPAGGLGGGVDVRAVPAEALPLDAQTLDVLCQGPSPAPRSARLGHLLKDALGVGAHGLVELYLEDPVLLQLFQLVTGGQAGTVP
jgi:hypothetical protein